MEQFVLSGLLHESRRELERRPASLLCGPFADGSHTFTDDERDTVWRHLNKNGVSCVRVARIDNRPEGRDIPTIIIGRDRASIEQLITKLRKEIVKQRLVAAVCIEVIDQ